MKQLEPAVDQLEIVTQTIETAVRKLSTMHCKFYIVSPNGTHYDGGLVVATIKTRRTRKPLKHPMGTIKQFFDQYMNYDLKPGEVCVIPCTADILPNDVRKALTAHLSNIWGNGSYTSLVHKNTVQIMRE